MFRNNRPYQIYEDPLREARINRERDIRLERERIERENRIKDELERERRKKEERDAIINNIPTQLITAQDLEIIHDQDCVICLHELNNNILCKNTNCQHIFHKACILEWYSLKENPKCPLCILELKPIQLTEPIPIPIELPIPDISDSNIIISIYNVLILPFISIKNYIFNYIYQI
jgi:hypothetical protein